MADGQGEASNADEQADRQEEMAAQYLLTEQSVLSNLRSGTIFEAGGRVTAYLTAVSSSLVAISFIGEALEMSGLFVVISLILFSALLFIGIVTFTRVLQNGIEDSVAARGMSRIRRYFLERAPQMEKYLVLSATDDMASQLKTMASRGRGQIFLTSASMIAVTNSVLAGVIAALLTSLFSQVFPLLIGVGVVVFVVSVVLHTRHQIARWNDVEAMYPPVFPSGETPER